MIALDAVALAELLRVTGPLESPGYGTLTARNLVQTLLVDAYARSSTASSHSKRRDLNNRLVDTMISRLAQDDRLLDSAKALTRAAEGGHFRLYFRTPALQRLVTTCAMDGGLTRPVNDYLGVSTKNGNGSKMDVFQHRELQRVVHLRRDGSATVRRTILIRNDGRASRVGRQGPVMGYETRLMKTMMLAYVPDSARDVRLTRDQLPVSGTPMRELAFVVYSAWSDTWPGEEARYELTYSLPHAAETTSEGLRYTLTMNPQPLVSAPLLEVRVVAPFAHSFVRRVGWTIRGLQAVWRGRLDDTRTLSIVASDRAYPVKRAGSSLAQRR